MKTKLITLAVLALFVSPSLALAGDIPSHMTGKTFWQAGGGQSTAVKKSVMAGHDLWKSEADASSPTIGSLMVGKSLYRQDNQAAAAVAMKDAS